MAKYRKLPVVIEATQWFKNGDHPEDHPDGKLVGVRVKEGAVVRYYRTPTPDAHTRCRHCNSFMHQHGWIDTLEGGHVVCPGDWVITGVAGERYPCKDAIFQETYEPVEDAD